MSELTTARGSITTVTRSHFQLIVSPVYGCERAGSLHLKPCCLLGRRRSSTIKKTSNTGNIKTNIIILCIQLIFFSVKSLRTFQQPDSYKTITSKSSRRTNQDKIFGKKLLGTISYLLLLLINNYLKFFVCNLESKVDSCLRTQTTSSRSIVCVIQNHNKSNKVLARCGSATGIKL